MKIRERIDSAVEAMKRVAEDLEIRVPSNMHEWTASLPAEKI